MNSSEITQPLHIALIDDEPRIHHVVKDILLDAGIAETVISFEDPLAFLEYLETDPPPLDFILLDVHFSNCGLTGVEVLPYIREKDPVLPVILLTGMEGDSIEEAQNFDFTYFIPKPVSPSNLIRMVKFYVGTALKSSERLTALSQDLDEHKELLNLMEEELASARYSSEQELQQTTKTNKIFERVKEILAMVLKNTEPQQSFYDDLEKLFFADYNLMKKALNHIILLDSAEEATLTPGLNIHKYIDLNDVENVYSLRLSRKARIFYYRVTSTKRYRLLRIDQEHNTRGMIKWLKNNYSSFKE